MKLDGRDGVVALGENTRAEFHTEPGHLIKADGDRIDFSFRYGEPFAIQMDCYVVRPHPLQNVAAHELISGSIIRDDAGLAVLGRNGRLDVTVDGSYVGREHRDPRIADYRSVATPDRLHIVDKHERLRGCGSHGGVAAAVPATCPGG